MLVSWFLYGKYDISDPTLMFFLISVGTLLIETPIIAFANRAVPDQAALVRAA